MALIQMYLVNLNYFDIKQITNKAGSCKLVTKLIMTNNLVFCPFGCAFNSNFTQLLLSKYRVLLTCFSLEYNGACRHRHTLFKAKIIYQSCFLYFSTKQRSLEMGRAY